MRVSLLIDGREPARELGVVSGKVYESINQVSKIELLLACKERLSFQSLDALVERPVTLSLSERAPQGEETARWDGMLYNIAEVERTWEEQRFFPYCMVVRPRIWNMSFTVNTRTFQNKSIPAIVDNLLQANGLRKDVDYVSKYLKLSAFPEQDQIVQMRTTDLKFLTKLLFQAGINFFFTRAVDDDDREVLALTDQRAFFVRSLEEPIRLTSKKGLVAGERHCWSFTTSARAVPQKVEVSSRASLSGDLPDTDVSGASPGGRVEVLVDSDSPHEARRRAVRLVAERIACQRVVSSGRSNVFRLRAGERIEIKSSDFGSGSVKVLVTGVEHKFSQRVEASFDQRAQLEYENHFTAVPNQVELRPTRIHW